MRVHLVSLFALLTATTFLAAQPVPVPDAYARKIKALQEQIDELRKQQEALRQAQEQAQKEKARAAHGNAYARVELRGKLVMTPGGTRVNERNQKERLDRWHVAVGDMLHPIRLSQHQMALADSYVDKEVIVHGVLESHRVKLFKPKLFQLRPIGNESEFEEITVTVSAVTVTSLKPAEPPKP